MRREMTKLSKKPPQPIKKMVPWWIMIVLCFIFLYIYIYVYLLKKELKELGEVIWLFCLLGSISWNIIHGRCDFVFSFCITFSLIILKTSLET